MLMMLLIHVAVKNCVHYLFCYYKHEEMFSLARHAFSMIYLNLISACTVCCPIV